MKWGSAFLRRESGVALVTIGVPVFNGENYLDEALASIHRQTFTDFVVQISDNGSSDRTPDIAQSWAAKDPRFLSERLDKNHGASANFNRLLARCTTPYFRWHAHDDVMHPDLLQACVDELQRNESLVGCTTQVQFIGPDGGPLESNIRDLSLTQASPSQRMGHFLLKHSRCDAIFGLYRTEVLRRTGQIPPYRGGDQVTLCELAILGPRLELASPLLLLREHEARSMRAHGSNDEITKWFDPASDLRIGSVLAHLLHQKLVMVNAQDLSFSQKVRCKLVLYWWFLRQSVVRPIKLWIMDALVRIGLRSGGGR